MRKNHSSIVKKRPCLILMTIGLLTFHCHAQNIVANGSFESPTVTKAASYGKFPKADLWPWQSQESVIELWANGFYGSNYRPPMPYPTVSAVGGQNCEILADAGTNTIWQTVSTVPGEDYLVSFYHTPRPNQNSILTFSANGNISVSFRENGASLANFDWRHFATNFTASGSNTVLAFQDIALQGGKGTATGAGTHIDGVILEHIPRLTIHRAGSLAVQCSWLGVSNEIDQLQYSTNLSDGNWFNLGSSLTNLQIINTNVILHNISPAQPNEFYRVITGP
jgi:hypothetical protein